MTKYIFVVGGVMSGVGKGVTASSLGRILVSRGLRVTMMKIDPYINVDAGTMNPTEHGEVFVLSDGYETDQDMGNYERFLDTTLDRGNYMTTGMIYKSVIEKERNLEYGGKCVEVVPHIPLEVIDRIKRAGKKHAADVCIVEIGGTVGEYQNLLFLEAARMMKYQNPKNVLVALVSYLPIPGTIGEMKTKPTQYAVQTLRGTGLQAEIIVARATEKLDSKRKEKLALACGVERADIVSAPDCRSIYEVPLLLESEGLGDRVCAKLRLKSKRSTLKNWTKQYELSQQSATEVRIAVVGKYFQTGNYVLSDSYLSVIEALKHAAVANGTKLKLTWIDSESYEKNSEKLRELEGYNGVLVPGGFGSRGVEGIIAAIHHCRVKGIPFFGICYGMQLAVVEYARSVMGLSDANTTEVNAKTKNPLIDILPEQRKLLKAKQYGASMRLGSYSAPICPDTLVAKLYGTKSLSERHRHRYEVNPAYHVALEAAGLVFGATSADGTLVETIELPTRVHPFYLAVQYHPEFQSSLRSPHPIFVGFIRAALPAKRSKARK
jgi:CTP synthase